MNNMERPKVANADHRPRIHLWPSGDYSAWSVGPIGIRRDAITPGQALDDALIHLGQPDAAVVILEPHETRQFGEAE